MAISTTNFALCNFSLNLPQAETSSEHVAHVVEFVVVDVIELQHDWIRLSAVNTRMILEVRINPIVGFLSIPVSISILVSRSKYHLSDIRY